MDVHKLKKGDWVKTRDGCWHQVRSVIVSEGMVNVGGFKALFENDIMEIDRAQRIKVVNEDGTSYIYPLLPEDCEGLDLD